MIPDFNEEGLMPPGVHETDLAELREKLGWSLRRRRLLEGLAHALQLMGDCNVERVYLDGSFVTDKDRPGDIDGCYDLTSEMMEDDLRRLHPIFPPTFVNRERAADLFGVDLFPADTIEGGSGQPFLDFFQEDSEGRMRGVLSLDISEEV